MSHGRSTPGPLGTVDDPALLCRLLAASNVAASYRLRGPHSDPGGAREVLMRLPVAFAKPVILRQGARIVEAKFGSPEARRILVSLRAYLERSEPGDS